MLLFLTLAIGNSGNVGLEGRRNSLKSLCIRWVAFCDKKSRSSFVNKTYLMIMLATLYQKHLKSQLSLAEYLLLKILIHLLQSIKEVTLEKLANALPLAIKFESRRKRIQRFLSLPNLTIEKVWLPIIQELIANYFPDKKIIYIAIDRTNWSRINLLMVSVIWGKRAIPIYFSLLPKLGSSNLTEQQKILSPVIAILKDYKICVLGDREFCSVKLAKYLQSRDVYFCLRLKKNEFV